MADLAAAVEGVGSNLKNLSPVLWDRMPDLADPPPGDPAGLRMRIVGAVTGFFLNMTRVGPVLCVFEDLHWADDDTVGLMNDLLTASKRWPMLVIATMRPAEMSASLRGLRSSLEVDEFESITLRSLSLDVTASIISDTIGHAPAVEVVAEIQRATGGNALWVGEVARKLAGAGGAAEQLHAGFSQQLPDTLAETIKMRLDDLGSPTASLMAQASVLGSTIDPALLAEVVDMPRGEVAQMLAVAERGHLVHPADNSGLFEFAHPLVQSTLYDSLDSVRLKRAHRRAGVAFEERAGPQAMTHAPELAHHFTKAGPTYAPKAYLYSAIAGKAALEVAAYERALIHLETALSLLHIVDESQREVQEFQLTMGKGMATMSVRGVTHPQAAAAFARVGELVEALPASPELLPGLAALWAMKNQQLDLPAARYYERKLLAVGELLPPGVDKLFGPWACLVDAVMENDFDAADKWALQCLRIVEHPMFAGSQYLYAADIDPVSLSYLCWCWVLNTRADDPQKALEVLEHGKALIDQAPEPRRTGSYCCAASIHVIRREFEKAETAAATSLEICDRLGIVQWSVWSTAYGAWARAMQGDYDAAALCRDAADTWYANGSYIATVSLAVLVAESCIAIGEPQLAHRFVERAFQTYPVTGEMFCVPNLFRVKAELAALDRTVGDPAELFQEALSLAKLQGARALELQAALSMARWNLDLGHEFLSTALRRIGPDVDLPDVMAARLLLGI
jgi:tetratricopeptide (TPR) repeat protein